MILPYGVTILLVLLAGLPRVTMCLKYFFGYSKYSSVTDMLLELGLPSFNILIHNYNVSFANRLSTCDSVIVQRVLQLN